MTVYSPMFCMLKMTFDCADGGMQVSMPGVSTHLLVPLPTPAGSETTQAPQEAEAPGTMHVHVCADNVCSLQVWHCTRCGLL